MQNKGGTHLALADADYRYLRAGDVIFITPSSIPFIADQCDCTCTTPLVRNRAIFTSILDRPVFWTSPSVKYLQINREYAVVFVPSQSGLVVVNEKGRAFVDFFKTPHNIDGFNLREYQDLIFALISAGILINGEHQFILADQGELAAWLHITNDCNLRCKYCYIKKTRESMSFNTGALAVDAVMRSAELHGFRNVKLKFSGGEPTLSMPMVLKIQDYAQARAAQLGFELQSVVLSNGTTLTDSMIKTLLSRNMHLMISLDGLNPYHDAQRPFVDGSESSTLVMSNICKAVSRGLIPEVSITVTNKSAAALDELTGWLLDVGVPFHLSFCRGNTSLEKCCDPEEQNEMYSLGLLKSYEVIANHLPDRCLLGCLLDHTNLYAPHQYTCGVGQNYLVIDHHGQIAKCQMQMDHSVTDVWASDPLLDVQTDKSGILNLSVDERECNTCEWRYWCAGGCPLETFSATGKYDSKSPKCDIYKQLLPEVIRLEGKRLLCTAQAWAK